VSLFIRRDLKHIILGATKLHATKVHATNNHRTSLSLNFVISQFFVNAI